MIIRRFAVLLVSLLAVLALGSAPALAAPGDSVRGDGTGPNAILGTNACSSALAYSAGQLGPYAKIQRETSATTGTCNFRVSVSYSYHGSSVIHRTPYTYRRDFSSVQGPQEAIRCRAYVGVQRRDGSWLNFTFYNNVGLNKCKKP